MEMLDQMCMKTYLQEAVSATSLNQNVDDEVGGMRSSTYQSIKLLHMKSRLLFNT